MLTILGSQNVSRRLRIPIFFVQVLRFLTQYLSYNLNVRNVLPHLLAVHLYDSGAPCLAASAST